MKIFQILSFCLFAVLALGEEEVETKIEETVEIEEGVLVLTEKNFDKAIEDNEYVLVEFYAPWCGHCKKLAPEYAKAATKMAEDGVTAKLAKVDATVESALATKFGIRGYPTLKFFRSGKPIDYSGPRDAEGIIQWIEKKTGPPAVEVSDVETLKKLKEDNEVLVIGFIKDRESDLAKEFIAAAGAIDDYKIAITSNDDVIKSAEGKDGSVAIFKKFDEPRVDYSGEAKSADIEAWILESSVPLVWKFTQTSAQKIFAQKAKVHFLYFIKVDNDAEKQTEPLKKVAEENKGKVVFVYIDTTDKANENVLKFFGIEDQMLPTYAIFEMQTNNKFIADAATPAKTEEVSTFIKKYFANELTKTLKSEEIPEDWDKNAVKVLVGKNFDEVAKDKTKLAFVEFYAPWCGHCKSLAPTWDKLGEEFKDDDSIVIAKVDSTANEIDGVDIKSFPTLKLFKKDTNEMVDYSGARDLETLVHFVKTGEQKLPKKDEEKEEEKEDNKKDEL